MLDKLKTVLIVAFVIAVLALQIAASVYGFIARYGFFDWGLGRLADAIPFL